MRWMQALSRVVDFVTTTEVLAVGQNWLARKPTDSQPLPLPHPAMAEDLVAIL